MTNPASYQSIYVRIIDDVAVITFRGTNAMFEGEKAQVVSRELFDLLESGAARKFVLDLANIYFMSSAMLAQLVRMQRRVQEKRGRLRLCCLRPAIMDAFKISRFDRYFEIFPDSTAALKKF
jgi:anti-sigma B factor antagonist